MASLVLIFVVMNEKVMLPEIQNIQKRNNIKLRETFIHSSNFLYCLHVTAQYP